MDEEKRARANRSPTQHTHPDDTQRTAQQNKVGDIESGGGDDVQRNAVVADIFASIAVATRVPR